MPKGVRLVRLSLHEQFIRKVNIPENRDECWIWTGLTDADGYGRFGEVRCNRYAYKMFRGEIGGGLFVCHQCDNPVCVNPAHLWLGTPKENSEDRNRKGRQARQQRIRPSLSIEQALEARKLMLCGWPRKKVAEKFGISLPMVGNIFHRKSWHFKEV